MEFINDAIQNASIIALSANFDLIRVFNNSEGLHPFDLNPHPLTLTLTFFSIKAT
jgi:hypothetical protein